MASHMIDFLTLGNNFGTPEMREVWSEENRLRQHVDVEVALAQAEGELGVIPLEAAEKIAERANAESIDLLELADEVVRLKHSQRSIPCNVNAVKPANIFTTVLPRRISWTPPRYYNSNKPSILCSVIAVSWH